MKGINSLIIEQTPKTPQIDLNQLTGDLIFSGTSIPENAAKVYEPVLNWVTGYILNARPTTNVRLNLDYFNTSTSLWLSKILRTLTQIKEPEFIIIVHIYLHMDEEDEPDEFDGIEETVLRIADIFHGSTHSIGIKVYRTDDKGEIIKDALVFI